MINLFLTVAGVMISVVVCVVLALCLFGLLVQVLEWASQVTWKSALTSVAYSAFYVIALVVGTGAMVLYTQAMGWLGSWLGLGLS